MQYFPSLGLSLSVFLSTSILLASADVNPSSANCTWKYVEQPLSHFERSNRGFYQQRVCVYDGYWSPNKSLPVLLYVGNESPVEEYVDNTGLMWDLGKEFNALIVFAEHRYFGESVPDIEGMPDCLAYLSSEEALADYASLSNRMRKEWGAEGSAVIAFGGSYGGMLASWMRILYPSAVDGAIAASAPVWGLPQSTTCPIDGSAQVVTYAASPAAGASANCAANLKASYVLATDIGSTAEGRQALSDSLNLCSPLQSQADVTSLIAYLQTPLFDLSEGSYPFPSNYITFALTDSLAELPPWAMQVLCEGMAGDYSVSFSGSQEDVNFSVTVGASAAVGVNVDWDAHTGNGYNLNDVYETQGAMDLIKAAIDSVQVWYNVTGTMPTCIDWTEAAPSRRLQQEEHNVVEAASKAFEPLPTYASRTRRVPAHHTQREAQSRKHISAASRVQKEYTPEEDGDFSPSSSSSSSSSNICTAPKETMDVMTAWNTLTCNEGINLINWWAQGTGNDLYWPPNQEKGATKETLVPSSLDYCVYLRTMGLYGLPERKDVWAEWLDTVYGGERMKYVTNIVYTNGNLDPWMPAGVPLTSSSSSSTTSHSVDPESEEEDFSIVKSLVIDMGGHHLDLFFPTEQDPQSVIDIREIEKRHIAAWIKQGTN